MFLAKTRFRYSLEIFLILLCAVMLTANIAIQQRNNNLEAGMRQALAARGPRPGSMLQKLQGAHVNGEPMLVDFAAKSRKSLLLVFSARCSACTENWPRWREILRRCPPGTTIVYADVANSVTNGYLTKYQIPADDVMTKVDTETKWIHDLRNTPQTVLLDGSGRIKKVWIGALTSRETESVVSLVSN